MKNLLMILSALLLITTAVNCSGQKQYHQKQYHKIALSDPSAYAAHFPDIDTSGDDLVSGEEFKAYFPDSDPHVYEALDLNKDGSVDHDEWHAFKEAHGIKGHD